MRNFSIDLVWAKVQTAAAAIGGYLGYFVGGVDGLMTALIIFMVIDYITGLMCAIVDRKLSSEVGFKGICKKVLIMMLVGVAHIVDLHVVGTGQALRSARAHRSASSRHTPSLSGQGRGISSAPSGAMSRATCLRRSGVPRGSSASGRSWQ